MKIILILTCLNSLFNTPIKIKVVDKNSGNPIAFVSYTRISDHKGSYSDSSGNIEFISGLNQKYILSCIGYHSDTIVPSKSSKVVLLNPKIIELKEFEVYKNKNIEKEFDIGYSKKGISLKPFYSILSRKMVVCTYIPKENKNETWLISNIKIDLGAPKSKDYEAFLIRLFIKEQINKLPGRDLLTKDHIVKINASTKGLSHPLDEILEIPNNGCFVGFETIGKIEKGNKFVAFSDFYEKPKKHDQFYVKMVKSNSYSLFRMGGFNAWFDNRRSDNHPDTYAIGLSVIKK